MSLKVLFRAPVMTASGYGVHSRQILRALLSIEGFDVSVSPTSWGQTPFVTDDEMSSTIDKLVKKFQVNTAMKTEYDVSVQCTIPNEFQKLAKINIGITAGIEVDRVSPEWIEKANENIDIIIVPSKHSADTFSKVCYQGQDGSMLKLNKKIVIVPEGVDGRFFNTTESKSKLFSTLGSKFNFLSVGLGLDKKLGSDRKNISSLIKLFCETFKDNRDVGLILKMSMVGYSLIDFNVCKARIQEIKKACGCKEFPKVYLVHGRLSDEEMASLYKHPNVKAFVTLTHGEGYGLPIIEAAACGLPVMATDWSGHLDFLSIDGKKKFVPFVPELVQIPEEAIWKGVMDEGSRWANVKDADVKSKLEKIVHSYEKPKEWAQELAVYIGEEFSEEKTKKALADVISAYVSGKLTNKLMDVDVMVQTIKTQLKVKKDDKTLLYTMPMSAGDVYISTAVVDSLKKKYPDYRIFFATDEKYSSILKDNKSIDSVVQIENWMFDVPFCEKVFDLVFTPNLAIQMTHSNWVRGGNGRLLADEMAHQCDVTLGDYSIKTEKPQAALPEKYITIHPGSGKGQWEARNYLHWQDVVHNLKRMVKLPIVQVGLTDEPLYDGCLDFRSKTKNYNELAYVIEHSTLLLGIDSVTMHMAAGLGVTHVALFGSSYSTSTGPAKPKGASFLLDAPNRLGCKKACYKYQCERCKEKPCINSIEPTTVLSAVIAELDVDDSSGEPSLLTGAKYEEFVPKIAGYTHVLNAEAQGFPYVESIKSMLGFCDEVVVVDGGSTDGTVEKIKEIGDARVKLFVHEWDWNEPGMDGMQKAFGRAMCSVGPNDFLWQQDADEVVHEDDYSKIKTIIKTFPRDADLLHLPVIELWGAGNSCRTDRHSWKWRLSRNSFRITHGINKDARVFDEKTGKIYAKKGMSDGCEYVDIMTGEFIPHRGFYSNELEYMRVNDTEEYGRRMNEVYTKLPSVWHYSWAAMERKIKNFNEFWDVCWANLYNEEAPVKRFDCKTAGEVSAKAQEMIARGGEHGPAALFCVPKSHPSVMFDWRAKSK